MGTAMANHPLGSVLRQFRRWFSAPAAESDRELLERFAEQRDEPAFAELVRRHGPMVRGVCRRLLNDDADADDAFQATFLVLARKAADVRWSESVAGWLHAVARRAALKARTRNARRHAHERQANPMLPTMPDTHAEWQELRPILDEELGRMPDKYREPVVLCYLEGLTHEDAARRLGCPIGSMSWRLQRGKTMLRERLEKRGLALASAALFSLFTASSVRADVPTQLLDSTVHAASGFAAAVSTSSTAAAIAEGVLQTMMFTRWKVAAAVLLALTLSAGAGAVTYRVLSPTTGGELALAVPVPEARPNDKAQTEPAEIPLTCRLVAQKDTYAFDSGGLTVAQLRERIEQSTDNGPPPPVVDLVLEVRNTGKEDIFINCGPGSSDLDRLKRTQKPNLYGPNMTLDFDLQGPAVVRQHYQFRQKKVLELRQPTSVRIAPGTAYSFDIQSLRDYGGYGAKQDNPATFQGARHWIAPGKYTLRAKLITDVAPGGKVTLTSNAVELKVEAVREISLKGLPADELLRGPATQPVKIADAAALAKAFPDKDEQEAIRKQVDFKQEQLLLFAWTGSGADKLALLPTLQLRDLTFRYTRGKTLDEVRHARLFVMPAGATWKVVGPANPAREIALNAQAPDDQPRKPKREAFKIVNAEELAKLIADKDLQEKILKEVDFKQEYLLLFAWAGSSGDRLTMLPHTPGDMVSFRMVGGIDKDRHIHRRLFAIPAGAAWTVEE